MSILCCTTFLFLKVLQATLKAFDDHKRIIRQEAVRCRQAWSSFFLDNACTSDVVILIFCGQHALNISFPAAGHLFHKSTFLVANWWHLHLIRY